MNFLDSFVLSNILNALDVRTLVNSRLVCAGWSKIILSNDAAFWRQYAALHLHPHTLHQLTAHGNNTALIRSWLAAIDRLPATWEISNQFRYNVDNIFIGRNEIEIPEQLQKSPIYSGVPVFRTSIPFCYFEVKILEMQDQISIGWCRKPVTKITEPSKITIDDGTLTALKLGLTPQNRARTPCTLMWTSTGMDGLPNCEGAEDARSTFGAGDVVGIGILPQSNMCFATLNSRLIGYPWLPGIVKSLITLESPGEEEHGLFPVVSFGTGKIETFLRPTPWKFDIFDFSRSPKPPVTIIETRRLQMNPAPYGNQPGRALARAPVRVWPPTRAYGNQRDEDDYDYYYDDAY